MCRDVGVLDCQMSTRKIPMVYPQRESLSLPVSLTGNYMDVTVVFLVKIQKQLLSKHLLQPHVLVLYWGNKGSLIYRAITFPAEPLTQHSCLFISTGLAPLASGLGACVTGSRHMNTACKIHPNSTLSPEQLVSVRA